MMPGELDFEAKQLADELEHESRGEVRCSSCGEWIQDLAIKWVNVEDKFEPIHGECLREV